jgi:flagellar biosynthesis/type III secretory pathway M-ring protein FliF/YscJ
MADEPNLRERKMEALLSSDFWFDQIAAAAKAWVIVIPLLLIVFVVFKIRLAKAAKKIRGLRAHAETVESRLELARELNNGEAETIAKIRTEVSELRRMIEVKTEPHVVEPGIKEAEASAATLAMNNRTVNHVLTAEKLEIGGVENRHRRRALRSPRRSA